MSSSDVPREDTVLEPLVVVTPVSPTDLGAAAKKDEIDFVDRKAFVWWNIDEKVTRDASRSRSRRSVVGEDKAIMMMDAEYIFALQFCAHLCMYGYGCGNGKKTETTRPNLG